MTRFARSRIVLSAIFSSALSALMTVATVFASSSNGPYPR